MKIQARVLNGSIGLKQFCVVTMIFLSAMIYVFCTGGSVAAGGWNDTTVRLLPDTSFAVVETAEGGSKTRHCPHHDANGKLDTEQLIYVLGTLSREQWVDASQKDVAAKHLEKHYAKLVGKGAKKGELKSPININTASLTELVKIPSIGPVLAVGIMEYRDKKGSFKKAGDIMKVKGIGKRTFEAVEHCVCVK